jgi:hypothetical protein
LRYAAGIVRGESIIPFVKHARRHATPY